MQQRLRIPAVTLYLLLGLTLWSQGGRGVQATPLDPTAFPSLGASPFTQDGRYPIDASKNNTAPTLGNYDGRFTNVGGAGGAAGPGGGGDTGLWEKPSNEDIRSPPSCLHVWAVGYNGGGKAGRVPTWCCIHPWRPPEHHTEGEEPCHESTIHY